MRLRPARWRDGWRIRRWRNDPDARRSSRNTDRVGVLEHARWYRRALRSPDEHVYIALGDWLREPIAMGRISRIPDEEGFAPTLAHLGRTGEVSVVVASGKRGQKLATPLIKQLGTAAMYRGYGTLIATARDNNEPSLRAFARAGYAKLKDQPEAGWVRMGKVLL